MHNYLRQWKEANKETRRFILTLIVYIGIIIVTGVWCYARLDFSRTGPPPSTQETK